LKYKASLKKNTEDKVETKCPGGGLPDDKGRCPGDTGYKPQLRDAPTDFAAVCVLSLVVSMSYLLTALPKLIFLVSSPIESEEGRREITL